MLSQLSYGPARAHCRHRASSGPPARARVATSRNRGHTSSVDESKDMRGRYEHGLVVVEEMKRTLRERAQAVAEREQGLEQDSAGEPPDGRGRATRELTSGSGRSSSGSRAAQAIAAAESREQEAVAGARPRRRPSASGSTSASRTIRKVERELAGLRMQLEEERKAGWGSRRPRARRRPGAGARRAAPPTPLPQPDRPDPDLEPAAAAVGGRAPSMLADPPLGEARAQHPPALEHARGAGIVGASSSREG